MDHEQHDSQYLIRKKVLPPDKQAMTLAPLPTITMTEAATLLDFSPDALVLIDSLGTLVLLNEQAATLFGYRLEELSGQPLEVLLPERFHAAHVAHRLRYVSIPHHRPMGADLDLVGRRKDGSEFPIDISLRPVQLSQKLHVVGAIRDVSTQRRMERERAQQLEQLVLQSTLINLAHDAILVRDPIGRVLSWNRGAEELYGWSTQEALGRSSHSLLRTHFPTSRATVDEQLEREALWEGELTHTHRDGHVVEVESRQVLIRDAQGMPKAILEIHRDITERKRLAQAQTATHLETLAQQTFLQQIVDILPSSICVVHGQEARLVLANRAAARIWGATWRPSQPMRTFLEEHDIRIVDEKGQTLHSEAWATMRALQKKETVLQYQEMIRQPSGVTMPVIVNAVPLSSPHWSSLGTETDSLTSQSRQEGEPLALIIYQDVSLFKEAEYFKDEFIGIAAHELRQPLSVLKMTVGTLVRQTARGHGPPLASWQQELLGELDIATDRLIQLTEDLLDASRLQVGQLVLHRTSTNLVKLIGGVVQRLQKSTTRHQLLFDMDSAALVASIDPQRIEQVLSNLLTNAIKYSPQGGLIHVTIASQRTSEEVQIQVQDEGLGIPAHQQGRIFGRFMRADNAQAAGISGTGLGLYLCRALVEQHGGRLWFESEEGRGTTFFLNLPSAAP